MRYSAKRQKVGTADAISKGTSETQQSKKPRHSNKSRTELKTNLPRRYETRNPINKQAASPALNRVRVTGPVEPFSYTS